MPHVVCAGLVTVDFFYHLDGFPVEGTKGRANSAVMVPGGGALFAASAIAALGGQVSLAGAVGDDVLGRFVRDGLISRGIRDLLDTAPVPTSQSAVLISQRGERTVVNHRDAELFAGLPPIPDNLDAVLVDTRWPLGGAALLQAAHAAGKPGVLDAEAPVRLAEDAVRAASHVVFSEQGLADFAGACDGAALHNVAHDLGVWVAVTRGALPVLCCDRGELFEVPGFAAHSVDTLGAGDVWHGAFALSLAGGQAEPAAVRYANAAAALKVGWRAGRFATTGEVEARLEAG